MEYTFGVTKDSEFVRVAGDKPVISGFQSVIEEYDDCTITHTFRVREPIHVGRKAAQYFIDCHVKTVDKTKAIKLRMTEQENALLELAEIITGG